MTTNNFASAYLSGVFWIEGEDTTAVMGNPRQRRFQAMLPLPTTSEFTKLYEAFDVDDFRVSVDCYIPWDIPIPDSNVFAAVNGKFAVRCDGDPMLSIPANSITPVSRPIGEGRDDMADLYGSGTLYTTAHVLGRVIRSHTALQLPQYGGNFRAFDIRSATFIKPQRVEFNVRVLLADGKRWDNLKSLPWDKSVIAVHGALLGYDRASQMVLLYLQDLDYIPNEDKSQLTEDTVASVPSTPQRPTRKRPFASPLKRSRATADASTSSLSVTSSPDVSNSATNAVPAQQSPSLRTAEPLPSAERSSAETLPPPSNLSGLSDDDDLYTSPSNPRAKRTRRVPKKLGD